MKNSDRSGGQTAKRCPDCHRPRDLCVCRLFDGVPKVKNRTGITILQHPRERFHPLNTGRIVRMGLDNARLEVAMTEGERSLLRRLELPAGAGLLFPHSDAVALEEVPPERRPAHLLVLDGTWKHARKLYQKNPWVQRLPRFRLTPRAPGRYRIRGEPDDQSLSTVEAVVQALQILEPQTCGLEAILAVFDAAIEAQVRQIRQKNAGARTRRPRTRPSRRVPPMLLSDDPGLVLAYVEFAPFGRGGSRVVQLAAIRPATGEWYERLLLPGTPPPDPGHLSHMGLSVQDLSSRGVDSTTLGEQWTAFLGDDPAVAAWNQSTLDLLPRAGGPAPRTALLKAAYCNLRKAACGALDQVARHEGLTASPTPFAGRAAGRLGLAVAVLHLLRTEGGDGLLP